MNIQSFLLFRIIATVLTFLVSLAVCIPGSISGPPVVAVSFSGHTLGDVDQKAYYPIRQCFPQSSASTINNVYVLVRGVGTGIEHFATTWNRNNMGDGLSIVRARR